MAHAVRLTAMLLAAALLPAAAGCGRRAAPVRPAAASPEAPGETAEARVKRAEAAAKLPAQPGVAAERVPLLSSPDFGSSQVGTLLEGTEVEVVLVEPDFYGIRTPAKGLAFAPARSIRLLPAPLPTPTSMARPRREIVPEIVPAPAAPGTAEPARD